MSDSKESFGGKWSDEKLSALRGYLSAYTTALKNTHFKLAYIDAFAGAGIREISKPADEDLWFDETVIKESEIYRHGSPLIALETDPPFHSFIFIEKDPESLNSLKKQVEENNLAGNRSVHYHQGDANQHLNNLTKKNWQKHRAVAFLDPFALEVTWETIARIGATEAIDMWLLFPAMAVNRMLPKNGEVPEAWASKLTTLFGDESWRATFYLEPQTDLFGEEVISKTSRIFERLSDYVTERLNTVFAKTTSKPLILANNTGSPLFLLCFASGNDRGSEIAVKIAQHIINKQSHGK